MAAKHALLTVSASIVAITLASCGADDIPNESATGTLSVSMTDAPGCGYSEVNVTVAGVRVHRSDSANDGDNGWHDIEVAQRKINLLDLQNGILTDLGNIELSTGSYSQIRLVLADNTAAEPFNNSLVREGETEPVALRTPSGQTSGLKLKHDFEITADTATDLVLDFEACTSVVKAGNSGRYNLKPKIAVIPKLTEQGAALEVSGTLGVEGASATVSAQIVDAGGIPRSVKSTMADTNGAFKLSPMPESASGTYNIVITKSGYQTLMIRDVPVSAGTPIELPAILMAAAPVPAVSASGTISVPDGFESNGFGSVSAIRSISGVPALVAMENANGETGEYDIAVSGYLAQSAPYMADSLTFTDDESLAHTLIAQASGLVPVTEPFDAANGDLDQDFMLVAGE